LNAIEYQRFGVQEETCKKVDGKIHRAICDRRSSLVKCSVIYKSTCPENYIPAVMPPLTHTSLPFSQHISWWCCNPPGIPSSITEILLFNSVFHNEVNPVSVSTLKLLLGVIGVLATETPSISYNFHLYIKLVVTL